MYNPIYLAILVPIIWAFADFLSKILINWCGSKQAVLLVQISATIFTILLVLFIKPPFPELSFTFLISVIGSSVLSALAWIFFFKGLEGRLSITEPIAYTWPLTTIVLSLTFYGERLSILDLLGISLALAGLVTLSLPKEGRLEGDVKFGLLTMICWGVGTFLLKPAILCGGPCYTVLFSRFIQLGLIAPFVLISSRETRTFRFSLKVGLLALVIGAANGGPFMLYTWVVSKLGAALPAAISSVSPAIVVLLSYFFLKERLTRKQIWGVVGAIVGLILLSI